MEYVVSRTMRNGTTYWQASCNCGECDGGASPTYRTRRAAVAWCDRMGLPYTVDMKRRSYGPGQYMGNGEYAGFTA